MGYIQRSVFPHPGSLLVLAGVFGLLQMVPAAQACVVPDAAALSKDVAKYKTVAVTVDDCIVQLNGHVDRLSQSWDVERKFRKDAWSSGVANYLTVITRTVDDKNLRRSVNRMLRYPGNNDLRSPFGFQVQSGVVTMTGGSADPMMLDTVLYAVASIKGVRGVVSAVQLDPSLNIDDIVQWTPKTVLRPATQPGPIYPKSQP
jgi:osmotically-inducible protein OsmY